MLMLARATVDAVQNAISYILVYILGAAVLRAYVAFLYFADELIDFERNELPQVMIQKMYADAIDGITVVSSALPLRCLRFFLAISTREEVEQLPGFRSRQSRSWFIQGFSRFLDFVAIIVAIFRLYRLYYYYYYTAPGMHGSEPAEDIIVDALRSTRYRMPPSQGDYRDACAVRSEVNTG